MAHETLTTPAVEEWRPVKGFEGLYEVSNFGRVRSVDRDMPITAKGKRTGIKHYPSKMLKLQKWHNGYLAAYLWKDNKGHTLSVHRLVAKAFIPNPDNLPCVNHKDQTPTNNHVSNLEWCTFQYNVTYANAIELRTVQYSKPIEQLTLDGQHVAYYKSAFQAEKLKGYDHSYLAQAARGKRKTAYGYQWRYKCSL